MPFERPAAFGTKQEVEGEALDLHRVVARVARDDETRRMNRFIVAAALAAVTPPGLGAQSTPNLSGTWTVDTAKSDPTPPIPAGGRGRGNPNQMVITQTPTEIIVAIAGANYIYNIDGSERSGPPGGETKSKMAWEGGRLIVTWKREYFAGPDKGYLTSSGRDTYEVDGNVLTVERTTSLPSQPAQTRKTVYRKTP